MAESVKIRILGDATGLTKALGVAESGLGKLGGVVSGFGKAAAAAMAAAGATAAAGFVNGFGDAMDRQALRSVVGDDILESSAAIYRDAWGESLEQVATVMAETERAFGEGANIETLTESAFILADKFGGDVNEAMQTASELAESFGVSGEHAFDLIAAASGDMSAEVRDELGSAIKEYGGVFNELGLSSENMLTLFADFGEGGAIQLDKVGDAFKELSIRSTDGSTATADAFALMGRDMGLYQELMLEGGDAAADATFGIIRALKEIEDPAAQAEAAIALFGTPLEDLGATAVPEFLDSVQKMGGGFKDVAGTTAALGEELGDNLRTKLESLKRQGLDKIAATIEKHVLPIVERFVDYGVKQFPVWRQTVLDAVGYVTDVVLPALIGAFNRVKDIAVEVYQRALPPLTAAFNRVKDKAVELYQMALPFLVAAFDAVTDAFNRVKDKAVELYQMALPFLVAAFDAVKDAAIRVFDWVTGNWDAIMAVLADGFDAVKDAGAALVDAMGTVFDALKTAFDWIKENDPAIAAFAAVVGTVVVGAVVAWATATYALVAGLVAQAAAFVLAYAPIVAAVAAVAALAAGLVWAYQNVEIFRTVVDKMADAAMAAFGWMRDNVPPIFDAIVGAIVGAFEWIKEKAEAFVGFVIDLWGRWGDTITEAATNAWGAIQTIVEGALGYLTGVFDFWKSLFTCDWRGMLDAIVEMVSGLWTLLKGAFLLGWEAVKLSFKAVFASVEAMAQGGFDRIVEGVKALPGLLWDALKAGGQLLLDAGAYMGDKIVDGLVSALRFVGEVIWDMLPGSVKWALENGASIIGGALGVFGGGDDPTTNSMGQDIVMAGTPGSYLDSQGNNVSLFGSSQYNDNNTAYGQGGVRDVSVYVNETADPAAIGTAVAYELQLANAGGR